MSRNFKNDDLIKFGLIPELVGRLAVHTSLDELDEEALIEILNELIDYELLNHVDL